MTVDDVTERMKLIEVEAVEHRDDEVAHSLEKRLWEDVLRAIAAGDAEDPAVLAAEALKTADIDFSRWYA